MNIDKFFDLYVDHLRAREQTIRSFIVTTSPELWFSLEAAALIDRSRTALGIDGFEPGRRPEDNPISIVPSWLVAAERGKIDVWVEGWNNACALQFKVIHNNQKFRSKIEELRTEIITGKAGREIIPRYARRVGVALFVYQSLSKDQKGSYQMQGGYGPNRMSCETCRKQIEDELNVDLSKMRCEQLFTLDGAHYTQSGSGSSVWISMWQPAI